MQTDGSFREVFGHFGTVPKCLADNFALVPKCPWSEVSWVLGLKCPESEVFVHRSFAVFLEFLCGLVRCLVVPLHSVISKQRMHNLQISYLKNQTLILILTPNPSCNPDPNSNLTVILTLAESRSAF